MAFIDQQGRVFGRVNLVDSLLIVMVLLAMPAAYAAHLLFRDPPPRVTRVWPEAVEQGSGRSIEIQGEHLRPYMRVSFGDAQALAFEFYGPSQAFVPAPSTLEPGTYDVVLYDYMREVSRLPKAFTVSGPMRPPSIRLRVRGAYIGLTPAMVETLKIEQPMNATEGVIAYIESKEATRPSVARVRVSDAVTVPVPMPSQLELPATLIVTCPTHVGPGGVLRCATAGVTFAPDMHLNFQGPTGLLLFRIDQVEGLAEEAKKP
jgi:hypothetical protein